METAPTTEAFGNRGVLAPRKFSILDIADALRTGWYVFRSMPATSMAYATLFVLIGLVLLMALGRFGISPMALPFAGGFMLVGPALLTGFFRLSAIRAEAGDPRLMDAITALVRAPAGLWLLALICSFLFLIWITDAAVLYVVMIGVEHLPYDLSWFVERQDDLVAFELWAAVMGSALALIIFAVSAFSVPLLHEGRANPVAAVHASVRAVFGSLVGSVAWGLVLTGATVLAIALLPLLTVVLPVLSYASLALYRKVFPAVETGTA